VDFATHPAACFANPVARYPHSQIREHGRTDGVLIVAVPGCDLSVSTCPLMALPCTVHTVDNLESLSRQDSLQP